MLKSILPSGWRQSTLGAIAHEKLNNGIFRKNPEYSESDSAGLPVVWVSELFNGTQICTDKSRRLNPTVSEVQKYGLRHGDILFCRSSLKPEGIGYSNVYLGEDFQALFECHVIRVSPNPKVIYPKFLNHLLRTENARNRIKSRSKTSTMTTIDQDGISSLSISFPELGEQRRIATILDQADALRAKRRQALAQLDRLAQTIFIEMFGDPVTNPRGWPVVSLTDICHCYSGGTPSKARTDLWVGNLPWFSAKDLKKNDLFDSQDHISESVPENTSLKLLPANTVTICVRGMILAHSFPVSVLRVPATINQDLKALLPRRPVDAQYLAACLRAQSDFILKQVSEAGHGTKRLDALGLREIRILLPPENLQNAFASSFHAIEMLRTKHCAALAELDILFISLQHRAFRGEL